MTNKVLGFSSQTMRKTLQLTVVSDFQIMVETDIPFKSINCGDLDICWSAELSNLIFYRYFHQMKFWMKRWLDELCEAGNQFYWKMLLQPVKLREMSWDMRIYYHIAFERKGEWHGAKFMLFAGLNTVYSGRDTRSHQKSQRVSFLGNFDVNQIINSNLPGLPKGRIIQFARKVLNPPGSNPKITLVPKTIEWVIWPQLSFHSRHQRHHSLVKTISSVVWLHPEKGNEETGTQTAWPKI